MYSHTGTDSKSVITDNFFYDANLFVRLFIPPMLIIPKRPIVMNAEMRRLIWDRVIQDAFALLVQA